MTSPKPIRLDDLASDFTEHEIVFRDGQKSRLRHIDGVMAGQIEGSKGMLLHEQNELAYTMAIKLLPDVDPSVVRSLARSEVNAIIAIASGYPEDMLRRMREDLKLKGQEETKGQEAGPDRPPEAAA